MVQFLNFKGFYMFKIVKEDGSFIVVKEEGSPIPPELENDNNFKGFKRCCYGTENDCDLYGRGRWSDNDLYESLEDRINYHFKHMEVLYKIIKILHSKKYLHLIKKLNINEREFVNDYYLGILEIEEEFQNKTLRLEESKWDYKNTQQFHNYLSEVFDREINETYQQVPNWYGPEEGFEEETLQDLLDKYDVGKCYRHFLDRSTEPDWDPRTKLTLEEFEQYKL